MWAQISQMPSSGAHGAANEVLAGFSLLVEIRMPSQAPMGATTLFPYNCMGEALASLANGQRPLAIPSQGTFHR